MYTIVMMCGGQAKKPGGVGAKPQSPELEVNLGLPWLTVHP